jgi:hypothetical protein
MTAKPLLDAGLLYDDEGVSVKTSKHRMARIVSTGAPCAGAWDRMGPHGAAWGCTGCMGLHGAAWGVKVCRIGPRRAERPLHGVP